MKCDGENLSVLKIQELNLVRGRRKTIKLFPKVALLPPYVHHGMCTHKETDKHALKRHTNMHSHTQHKHNTHIKTYIHILTCTHIHRHTYTHMHFLRTASFIYLSAGTCAHAPVFAKQHIFLISTFCFPLSV